jgi:zinc/manganese transport system substrate-binding protein
MSRITAWWCVGLAMAAAVTGCATTPPASGGKSSKITVVAAENTWGSIAAQLGGNRVAVTSIVNNPNTDPHDYEPTPADARTFAGANLAIVNGIGYDAWASQLLAANPSPQRTVLNVGDTLHVPDSGNPHQWYSPTNVDTIINQITSDYQKIDPADSGYFAQQKQHYESVDLSQYHQLASEIKTRYATTPIGASESIVSPLAADLGLNLLTPSSYLDAISEGSEPTAQDKITADNQIKTRQIKVFVLNTQNSTPDVQALANEAAAAHIPVVQVTETPTPGNATFQAWQTSQLRALANALGQTHG